MALVTNVGGKKPEDALLRLAGELFAKSCKAR
jgi:hypothetical protein